MYVHVGTTDEGVDPLNCQSSRCVTLFLYIFALCFARCLYFLVFFYISYIIIIYDLSPWDSPCLPHQSGDLNYIDSWRTSHWEKEKRKKRKKKGKARHARDFFNFIFDTD